jgi:hypothetical protein
MRCEEARALLQQRSDAESEAHLEACTTCFAWLEEHDPLVSLLCAAAPSSASAPRTISAGVLRRWPAVGVSWRLGIAAAGGLAFLAALVLWIGLVSAPAAATALLADAGTTVNALGTILSALLAVPRALLFDNPSLLAVYLFLTIAVCMVWVRLYQRIPVPRRVSR